MKIILSPALLIAATLLTGCSINKTYRERANEGLEHSEKHPKSGMEAPRPIDEKVAILWEADPRYRNAVTRRGGKLPRLVSARPLRYPNDPRVADQTAAVIVTIAVNQSGQVEEAKIAMTSNKRFDSTSLDVAREMKFTPMGSGPVKYFFSVPMIYVGQGAQMTRTNSNEAKPDTASTAKLPRPKPGGAAVMVRFTVEEDGRVSSAQVEKTNDSRFNDAALASVKGRKFPARPKGSGSHQARLKISFQ